MSSEIKHEKKGHLAIDLELANSSGKMTAQNHSLFSNLTPVIGALQKQEPGLAKNWARPCTALGYVPESRTHLVYRDIIY
jgi:hypothetical protein